MPLCVQDAWCAAFCSKACFLWSAQRLHSGITPAGIKNKSAWPDRFPASRKPLINKPTTLCCVLPHVPLAPPLVKGRPSLHCHYWFRNVISKAAVTQGSLLRWPARHHSECNAIQEIKTTCSEISNEGWRLAFRWPSQPCHWGPFPKSYPIPSLDFRVGLPGLETLGALLTPPGSLLANPNAHVDSCPALCFVREAGEMNPIAQIPQRCWKHCQRSCPPESLCSSSWALIFWHVRMTENSGADWALYLAIPEFLY